MEKYLEKIFKFGDDNCLVGVVSEPNIQLGPIQETAVIILNAGLIHRVGLQRMSTEIARKLSSKGFLSFRVDLYGVGDSLSQKGEKSFRQRAFEDIKKSMDFLSLKYAINNFVLVGHCSGADNAHFVSVEDDRVAGAVFIDGFGYPTLSFKLKDYGGKSKLNILKWTKTIIKKILGLFFGKSETKSFHEEYGRRWPSYKEAKKDIGELINRNVNLLYIYTGGVPMYFNYKNQFSDMFKEIDFKNKIEVAYIEKSDHNLTLIESKNIVKKTICNWVSDKFISTGKK